jgi:hypothetical protein
MKEGKNMTGQEGELDPFAARRATNHLTAQQELAEQARQLGQQHRTAAITPFGDADYVYWDEGSARLLNALGITSPTTDDNAPGRQALVDAYCGALEPREAEGVEPGAWWHLICRFSMLSVLKASGLPD